MRTKTWIVALLTGIGFGYGLSYSTMTHPESILDFLRWRDFGLLLVLGGALLVAMPTYQILPRLLRKPLLAPSFGKHSGILNRQTVGGAALFGIGWGIGGVCPGPAIAGLGAANWPLLVSLGSMLLGAYVHGWVASRSSRAAAEPTAVAPNQPFRVGSDR
jgi:uncharacterized membrane protein YedE/YeeE